MAGFTLFAQTTKMYIVLFMTTEAVFGQIEFFLNGVPVAGMAVHPIVFAVKRIIGLLVVVKLPRHPL